MWGLFFFSRAVLNALKCVGIAALGEVIMYSKSSDAVACCDRKPNPMLWENAVFLPRVSFRKTCQNCHSRECFNDERCMFHVNYLHAPTSFSGEETSVFKCSVSKETECSRVGKQSFIITLGCNSVLLQFSSPAGTHWHQPVPLAIYELSFFFSYLCVFMFCFRLSVLL